VRLPSWRTPLAIAVWPAAYRERFELAREGAGRFSLRMRRRRWRKRTWEMAETDCGCWLSYLERRELLDLSTAPEALIVDRHAILTPLSRGIGVQF
jgi:hypothetical protein